MTLMRFIDFSSAQSPSHRSRIYPFPSLYPLADKPNCSKFNDKIFLEDPWASMLYSVPLGNLTAERLQGFSHGGVLFTASYPFTAVTFRTNTAGLKVAPLGWSDHSSSETGEKKMASETESKTIVAPGLDTLFEFARNYGLIILLFSVLLFFAYLQFNVVSFIPGAAWHVPAAAPAAPAEAPK